MLALQVLGLNFQRSRRKCEQLSRGMTHKHTRRLPYASAHRGITNGHLSFTQYSLTNRKCNFQPFFPLIPRRVTVKFALIDAALRLLLEIECWSKRTSIWNWMLKVDFLKFNFQYSIAHEIFDFLILNLEFKKTNLLFYCSMCCWGSEYAGWDPGIGAIWSLVKYKLPNWIKIIGFTPSLALRSSTRIFSLFDEWV